MKYIECPVINCARCGGEHLNTRFFPFERPPVDATHWGICQKTGDPILMTVTMVPKLEPAPHNPDSKQ